VKRLLTAMFLLPFLSALHPAVAQSGCEVGTKAASFGFWSWAPGAKVKVYVLTGDFSENEIPFLLAPLRNWNAVSEATGSRVKLEYVGSTTTPLHCENCLTITRGSVFDKGRRHLTELRTLSMPQTRAINWAIIVVDPRLTNHDALTNAIAHELGHSFGLLDCYSCSEQSTVMNQFKTANVSNRMEGPTACDVAQVKSAYRALAAQAAKARKIVVDEGEEPVDDDTPIVVRRP
jgi:hypothetical protein